MIKAGRMVCLNRMINSTLSRLQTFPRFLALVTSKFGVYRIDFLVVASCVSACRQGLEKRLTIVRPHHSASLRGPPSYMPRVACFFANPCLSRFRNRTLRLRSTRCNRSSPTISLPSARHSSSPLAGCRRSCDTAPASGIEKTPFPSLWKEKKLSGVH